MLARIVPPVMAAVIAITHAAPNAAADNRPNPYVRSIPASTITVSAAASLTDVFPVIAEAFTKRYPQLQVTFNFGSSNSLVEQIRAGAPADVVATADEVSMWRATNANLTGAPILFARNTMAIATPKGNPAKITGLADLQKPTVTVAVCASQVPCGRLAAELFAKNFLTVTPVTKEVDVRSVVGKVIADQVDAGIVYSTDVKAFPDDLTGVSIPTASNVVTNYPIAMVKESRNAQAAKAFVNYVRYSSSAQRILRAWGFSKPW
ncbi:MAG: molybdate ABC transporter substrate-binding protein [Actinomycetota bacterium]